MKKMQSIMIESLNVVFNFAFAGMSVMLASAVFCILRLRRHPHYFTRVCERQGAHTYKIAYLLAVGLRIGGALTHIQGFINGLIADGIRVLLIAQDTVPGIRNDSIVVHLVRSWEKPRRIPLTIAILAQNLFLLIDSLGIIRAERPDAIYQRHSGLNFTGVLLSLLCGVPLVLEYNSSSSWKQTHNEKQKLLWLLRYIERINMMGASRMMVVSDVLKNRLTNSGVIDDRRVVVNPNGADPDLFNPDVDGTEVKSRYGISDSVVVGFCGTYGPWHGVEYLMKSIPEIIAALQEIRFLFIGDSRLKSEIEMHARENNTLKYLHFAENIAHDQMPKYLAACDILVSPHSAMPDGSTFFGSPVKMFEYMSMARPIVASKVGQISEVLTNNKNALLVEPAEPHQLAVAILELARSGELRRKLGEAARERLLESYTWKHNAKRFIDACLSANCTS